MRTEIEDGMGFNGLVSSLQEKQEEKERKEELKKLNNKDCRLEMLIICRSQMINRNYIRH